MFQSKPTTNTVPTTHHIRIKATAGAKRASLKKISDNKFEIAVKEPAEENRANTAVLHALATHLKIPVKNLRIMSGHHKTSKIISVKESE